MTGERLSPRDFRRALRREATEAEQRLWWLLRARRLGSKFRRQHTVGPYTLDFYAPSARLAVELDGGGHFTPEGQVRDAVRDAFLAEQGIRVLRITDRELLLEREAMLEVIWQAVEERVGRSSTPRPPHPRPLSPGGGEGRT